MNEITDDFGDEFGEVSILVSGAGSEDLGDEFSWQFFRVFGGRPFEDRLLYGLKRLAQCVGIAQQRFKAAPSA